MYQEKDSQDIIDNTFLLDIQELLADDEDDAFLIECIEQFETGISTTVPNNNNELTDENIDADNAINITGNTSTTNDRIEHDDQDTNTNKECDVSNEFLMEGGEWLWHEFLQFPQPTALEMIQSNEKPFEAAQVTELINNADCGYNNGKRFQFLLYRV
jgi:hypothetical protein